jgi:hypothetical protein
MNLISKYKVKSSVEITQLGSDGHQATVGRWCGILRAVVIRTIYRTVTVYCHYYSCFKLQHFAQRTGQLARGTVRDASS